MFKRIVRSLVGFSAIIVAYQAYVLVAVPWMEPPIGRKESTPVSPIDIKAGNQNVSRYQRLLSHYFPADHWSQQRPPKVISSSNESAMLVLDDYDRHEDGRVEIARFALLVFPTPLREGGAPPRDAIVLEAPQGAKLQFDEFRPERGQIGRITRGEFPGRITIRSDMKEPGPEDDLQFETADATMNTKLLYTTSPVRFRMGRNVGGGNELEIRFLDDEHSQSTENGLKIAGLDALEIRRDVRARLYLDTENLLPGDDKRTSVQTSPDKPATDDRPPVEVTCSGPFHFDFVRYVAGFDRDVEVRQLNANGPSDQISAQQLDIHFAPRQEAGAAADSVLDPAKRQHRELGRLEPAVVVAQGHPVVVTSPTRNAEARGGRIQLGLRDQRVVITGGSDVRLIYGQNVLRAPAIEYQHPARDATTRIGRFRATGPGTLDYVLDPAKPEQIFRATWQTSVELGRFQDQPVLTLAGRPLLGVSKMGALEADRIQLFVREIKDSETEGSGVQLPGNLGGNGTPQIVPERLAASGRVDIESRELTGNTDELLVAFQVEPSVVASGSGAPSTSPAAPRTPDNGQRIERAGVADVPQQSHHIDTDRLRISVAVRGERMVPTNLSCEGNVLFREIPLVASAEKPLEVRGGQLTIDNLDTDMHVTILGATDSASAGFDERTGEANGTRASQEAQVAVRGMTLLARAIQLDQRANRLWIEGPGKANVLVANDALGGVLQHDRVGALPMQSAQNTADTVPTPLDITWRGGLNFNGEAIVLDRDVTVDGADDWVHCDQLTASLTQPVKFGEHIDQRSIGLAEIECRGQVALDHRMRDELGLAHHERGTLERLKINLQNGEVSGDGPGEIRSTHFSDQANLLNVPAHGAPPAAVSPPPGVRAGKLHFLQIEFRRALAGNLSKRELRFSDKVRAVYGPVDSWEQELDAAHSDDLPPQSMTLSCDDLSLNEDPQAVRSVANPVRAGTQSFAAVQVRANGNVRMGGLSDSERFGAQADAASYDQLKDVFLLKGNPRTPAMLWRRKGIDDNSPPVYATEIRYDRATGQMSGTFRSLEFLPGQLPQSARGPQPQSR